MAERPPIERQFDIETTNLQADMGVMLTFAHMDRGNKKPTVKSIHDFPLFKREPWNDEMLVRYAHEKLSEADSLIAHFGDGFDIPFVKTRMLKIGLHLPRKHTVDTCKVAWKHLKLSARLDNLAEFLGLTPKVKVPKDVWKRAGFGEIKALEFLKKRCGGDVITLDEIVTKMLPLCKMINKNLFYADKGCPQCSSKRIRRDGAKWCPTGQSLRQTYECQECGSCFRGELLSSPGPFRQE